MRHSREGLWGRLFEELKLVPWWGYVASVALVLFLTWLFGEQYVGILKRIFPDWPILHTVIPPLAVLMLWIWSVMVFYVARDAGERQMNAALWTLLVVIIPNALGFIVYLLLREPVGRPCPKCRASVRPNFVFCPVCAQPLIPSCPACRHAVEPGWASCAFCGAQLEASPGPAPLPNY